MKAALPRMIDQVPHETTTKSNTEGVQPAQSNARGVQPALQEDQSNANGRQLVLRYTRSFTHYDETDNAAYLAE